MRQHTARAYKRKSMGARLPSSFISLTFEDVHQTICLQGNYERIMESIEIAKGRGATLRVGPELEIPSVVESHSRRSLKTNHNIHRQRIWMLGSFS